ncbi:MAG: WD40 repeat domain-containing protein, partial [Cyanobacteria bacterium J06629_18]
MKILRDYIKLNIDSIDKKVFAAKTKRLTAVLLGVVGIVGITNLPSIKPATAQVVIGQTTTNSFTNPKLTHTFNGHKGAVKSVFFSPDGRMLVSGGSNNDGIIHLWNLKKKKKLGKIKKAHQESIQSLLISPDGRHLVSSSTDNTVNIWSLETYKFIRTFRAHSSNVLSLAVTPDSKVLVSGALDGIRVWDLLQQRPLGTLSRYDSSIHAVAISPDGRRLVSGDSKG